MTKHKDFGAGTASGEKEDIKFTLHGEDFACRPELQGKVLLDLVAKSSGEDVAAAAKVIDEFFENVLLEESFTRFSALLKHPDKIVNVETLGQISSWLVEAYSARPNQGPEVS